MSRPFSPQSRFGSCIILKAILSGHSNDDDIDEIDDLDNDEDDEIGDVYTDAAFVEGKKSIIKKKPVSTTVKIMN